MRAALVERSSSGGSLAGSKDLGRWRGFTSSTLPAAMLGGRSLRMVGVRLRPMEARKLDFASFGGAFSGAALVPIAELERVGSSESSAKLGPYT